MNKTYSTGRAIHQTKTRRYFKVRNRIIVAISVLTVCGAFVGHAYAQTYLLPKEVEKSVTPTSTIKVLSMRDQVLQKVEQAGIDKYKAWALIQCESRWDGQATLVNQGGKLGIDRGLWQLSSLFHKEVSNSCAYDELCSTDAAIKIIKEKGMREWSCGKSL